MRRFTAAALTNLVHTRGSALPYGNLHAFYSSTRVSDANANDVKESKKRMKKHPLMREDWDPDNKPAYVAPRKPRYKKCKMTKFQDATNLVMGGSQGRKGLGSAEKEAEDLQSGFDDPKPANYKLLKEAPVEESMLQQIEMVRGGLRKGARLRESLQAIDAKNDKQTDGPVEAIFNRKRFAFESSIGKIDHIKTYDDRLVEFCFCGRSNVGKSSLINKVIGGGGGKARVSNRPGETRTINFYRMGDSFRAVDLPGYGFAFAKEEKSQHWITLMETYIKERSANVLKRVFVLIDSRHGLKRSDIQFLQFLNKNDISNQIIMTKNDLVDAEDLAKRMFVVAQETRKLKHTQDRILLCSSETKSGIVEIQKLIISMMDRKSIAHAQKRVLSKKNKKIEEIKEIAAD